MSDSKKVLLIAPYFIPRRRVGSLRPFKFAIHLSSLGYKPIVLTIGHQPNQLTPTEMKMLKGIEILSIESPFDRTSRPNKNKKTEKSTSTNEEKGKSTNTNEETENRIKKNLFEPVLSWFDKNCPIDTWVFLFILRWGWIKRVAILSKPDLIMATGDPWSGLWLGEKLSKKLNVPFVADFRDPWTLGSLRLRERSLFSAGRDKIIEKRVIEHADRVIFTSKQTNRLYSEKYQLSPIKTATLYNSFEPRLMKESSDFSNSPNWDPSKINILFLGHFRRLSSASLVVDFLKEIQFSNPVEFQMLRIHSFGEPDKDEKDQIYEARLTSTFIFHDPFEPEESLPIMNSADLLLLSTSRERSNIIPAKLWDYLFSDVPILSIVPNPEVGSIVNKTSSGVHFPPENLTEISGFLIQLIQAKQSGDDLPLPTGKDVKHIQEFTSKAVTIKLATVFNDLLSKV